MTNTIGALLSLAVTASIALANGGEEPKNAFQEKAGWKPGSGINLADSDDFKLNLINLLQVQWSYTDKTANGAQDVNSFSVRRARTTLSGHAFTKNLLYLLRLDAVDTQGSIVKDAWAQWNFLADANTVGLRMGQGKPGFGLESTGLSSGLLFVERSSASRLFSDQRSRGAWLYGSHSENKLRWNLGAQNGDVARGSDGLAGGEEVANTDNELDFVGNISFDPMGDTTGGKTNEAVKQGDFGTTKELRATFGAGVELGNGKAATPAFGGAEDIETTSANLNTAWWFGNGLSAQAEVFTRTDTQKLNPEVSQDSNGWYVMANYITAKAANSDMQWGFGVRVSRTTAEDPISFMSLGLPLVAPGSVLEQKGDVTEVSAVVDAFYHGHACKTQIEYTWQEINADVAADTTNHILRVQFQLLF